MRTLTIAARDGDVGRVVDWLFDDEDWLVRHLVVDTGAWLPGKRVLIDCESLERPQPGARAIPTRLTQGEVREAPQIDADPPVSHEQRKSSVERFLWPPFWPAMGLGGAGAIAQTSPAAVPLGLPPRRRPEDVSDDTQEPHLRSADEVQGYAAVARDGEAGQVRDLLVESATWTVPQIVLELRGGVPVQPVLVSTSLVLDINFTEKKVSVDATREELAAHPACDPASLGPPA